MGSLNLIKWLTSISLILLVLAVSSSEAAPGKGAPRVYKPSSVNVESCNKHCVSDFSQTCSECCFNRGYKMDGVCAGWRADRCNCTPNYNAQPGIPPNLPRPPPPGGKGRGKAGGFLGISGGVFKRPSAKPRG